MSKQRMIETKFWSDEYIQRLDPSEKLLFLYFLTNEHTEPSGIYEITLKTMCFETGFEREIIEKLLERMEKDGKIYYFEGYIIIKNFLKHQSLNPNMIKGIKRALSELPAKITLKLKEIEYPFEPFETLSKHTTLKPKLKPKPKLKLKLKEDNSDFVALCDYFIKSFLSCKGVEYTFGGGKDGSAINSFLKRKTKPEYKALVDFYLKDEKSDRHPSISACLSTDTINKFNLKNKPSWAEKEWAKK